MSSRHQAWIFSQSRKVPVKWRNFQDFSRNLRSLQLEGFVDALFVSSSMAQMWQNGHRRKHRREAFKHSLDGPFGRGHAGSWGWLVIGGLHSHTRCLHGTWTTEWQETHPYHKISRSRWRAPKGMCTCRKPMFPRHYCEGRDCPQTCPLQWDPSAEMASFWPTLKLFKNAGWTLVGALAGALVGASVGGM